MDAAVIKKCQAIIGYKFKTLKLLETALTHSSVAATRAKSNERMEFLGDSVLGLVICHELFEHADEMLEGHMTKIKSTVVSRQTCAKIAYGLGISELLYRSKGMSGGAELPMSIAAAAFEAVIGAIYIDGGLAPAAKFILESCKPFIDEALVLDHQGNYKSLLQQQSQRKWGTTPHYQVLDEKGPDHSKCFEVGVAIDGVHFPSAWGMTKKEAEQEAARQALVELGTLPAEESGEPKTDQGT